MAVTLEEIEKLLDKKLKGLNKNSAEIKADVGNISNIFQADLYQKERRLKENHNQA